MANILLVQFVPRWHSDGKHLTPVVKEACRRTVWDNSVVTIETISAAHYHAIVGDQLDDLLGALDAHAGDGGSCALPRRRKAAG